MESNLIYPALFIGGYSSNVRKFQSKGHRVAEIESKEDLVEYIQKTNSICSNAIKVIGIFPEKLPEDSFTPFLKYLEIIDFRLIVLVRNENLPDSVLSRFGSVCKKVSLPDLKDDNPDTFVHEKNDWKRDSISYNRSNSYLIENLFSQKIPYREKILRLIGDG